MIHSGNLLNISFLFEQARKDGLTEKEFFDWLLHVNFCNKNTGATFASLHTMILVKHGQSAASTPEERKKEVDGWCKTLANRRASIVKKGWLIKVIDHQRGEDGRFKTGASHTTSTYQIPHKLWRLCRYCSIDMPPVGNFETDEYGEINHNPENEDYGYPQNRETGENGNSTHIPEMGITEGSSTVIPETGNRNPGNRDRNPGNRDAEPLVTLSINPYIEVVGDSQPPPPSLEVAKLNAIKSAITQNPNSLHLTEAKGFLKAKGLDFEKELHSYAMYILPTETFPLKNEHELVRRFHTTCKNYSTGKVPAAVQKTGKFKYLKR